MFKTNFPGHNTLWGEDQKCLGAVIPNSYPWLQACTPVD